MGGDGGPVQRLPNPRAGCGVLKMQPMKVPGPGATAMSASQLIRSKADRQKSTRRSQCATKNLRSRNAKAEFDLPWLAGTLDLPQSH